REKTTNGAADWQKTVAIDSYLTFPVDTLWTTLLARKRARELPENLPTSTYNRELRDAQRAREAPRAHVGFSSEAAPAKARARRAVQALESGRRHAREDVSARAERERRARRVALVNQ